MDKFKNMMRSFGTRLAEGFRRRWWYLIVVACAVALDQLTKWIAVKFLKGAASVTFIPHFITWRYYENRGSAYGMFADQRWVFMTVSVVGIIVFLLYLYGKGKSNILLDTGLALVIGGGIGNMIDRVALGYVVDFIGLSVGDIYLFNFTCNVADIFVTVGGVVIFLAVLIDIIREEMQKKRKDSAVSGGADAPVPEVTSEENTGSLDEEEPS